MVEVVHKVGGAACGGFVCRLAGVASICGFLFQFVHSSEFACERVHRATGCLHVKQQRWMLDFRPLVSVGCIVVFSYCVVWDVAHGLAE